MNQNCKDTLPGNDDLMKQVGALKEAKEELQEELKNENGVSPEEAGSILGSFLKGLLSVFKW